MFFKQIFLVFLAILLFTGCSNTSPELSASPYSGHEKYDVNILHYSLDPDTSKIQFEVCNRAGSAISYGTKWYLETIRENQWYTVDFLSGKPLAWPDVLLHLNADVQTEIEIPLSGYYVTPLSAGQYRLVQPVGQKILCFEFEIE